MLMMTLLTCLLRCSRCSLQCCLRRLELGRLFGAGLSLQQLFLLVSRTFVLICSSTSRTLEGG